MDNTQNTERWMIYFNAMAVGLALIELASYGYYPLKGEENGFAWWFWYTEP